MDYGKRQERADFLIKCFNETDQSKLYKHKDKDYTMTELAKEIENETDLGKSLVAISGFVISALQKQKENIKIFVDGTKIGEVQSFTIQDSPMNSENIQQLKIIGNINTTTLPKVK